ncbi:hypothetical protein [Streptomyces aureus]
MNIARIAASLGSLTSAALTAIGAVAPWIALLILLPHALGGLISFMRGAFAAYSDFRRESMRRRHEDRLLAQVDAVVALQYLERVGSSAGPGTAQGQVTVGESESDGPARASPP